MTQHQREIDYLVSLAQQSPGRGIVEEPRVYYDAIRILPGQQIARSAEGVFSNGEAFPVGLTHLTAAIQLPEDSAQLIQRVAMRLVMDGSYYQSAEFLTLPNWHDVQATGAAVLGESSASYTFDRPLIVSSRNSLAVTARLENIPSAFRDVEVAFKGTGLLSNKPYLLSGRVRLTNVLAATINPDFFRNGGAEPIALTDMTVFCSADGELDGGPGDIRECRVQVRSIIDGTQAVFFQGPTVLPDMPAVLLGKTTGTCLVHRFNAPFDMLPGRSFYLEVIGLDSTVDDVFLAVGAHGTIFVE